MDKTEVILNAEIQHLDLNLANHFTPVSADIYKDIISYLQEKSVDVTFKVYDIHSKSAFVHVDGSDLAIFKKFPYDYETTTIMCAFKYNNEPHFFRSKISTSANYYLVRFPEKIYRIQRRANFRFQIPMGLEHEVKLLDHGHLKAELRDISLSGCKVALRTTTEINLPLESDVRIWIRLLDFGGVHLNATVAFTKFMQPINSQIVGLKFGFMDSELISLLHQTLIQVDRIARGKDKED